MNNYFNQFAAPGLCNCETCKRSRFQQDLMQRLAKVAPKSMVAEVQLYLNWNWEALEAAETEIEASKVLGDAA